MGEVTRGIEVVEFACGLPQLLKTQFSDNIGGGIDNWNIRQSLGRNSRHHAIQFSFHGTDVDGATRYCLWQHFHTEAFRT